MFLAPFAHAQSLGETLQECPGTLTGSTQPQQIHLQMTDDASVMNVVWATEGRSQGEVEWNGQTATSTDFCYNHDMAFHMASMTGLVPGEEVTYRVSSGGDWSEEFIFTPIDSTDDHFQWISIADHGDSSEAMDVSEAIIADTTAQIVTVSGDIAYADGEQSTWDNWFNFQQDSMASVPWVTAVGNHENEPGYGFSPYEHRFDSDGQSESEVFWYSRDFPGVHMVCAEIEKASNYLGDLRGDVVLCVQVMHNRHFATDRTVPTIAAMCTMLQPGGTLIFNLGKSNMPFEAAVDALLVEKFTSVKKRPYGAFSTNQTYISPILAILMYLLPPMRLLGGARKIFYVCHGAK